MELKNKLHMKHILPLILALCLFTNCSKDDAASTKDYTYYYPTDEAAITNENIPGSTEVFDPKGIAISKEKLYVINGNVLEIFNALTLEHIKTIKEYNSIYSLSFLKYKQSSLCLYFFYWGSLIRLPLPIFCSSFLLTKGFPLKSGCNFNIKS